MVAGGDGVDLGGELTRWLMAMTTWTIEEARGGGAHAVDCGHPHMGRGQWVTPEAPEEERRWQSD
jgi:hypothetical protein